MVITKDIILRGTVWRQTLERFSNFWPKDAQPMYNLYALSISVGIMYDKQVENLKYDEEKDQPINVPRTVLQRHNSDLDFMFQTAILTSKLVSYSVEERLKLAFDTKCDIEFDTFDFLTKFANFGINKLYEISNDQPLVMMEKLKNFLASSVEGYNYEMNKITDEELGLENFTEEDISVLIEDLSKLK